MALEKYRQKIAGGGRNRAAVYELALTSGRAYRPGDQLSYYVKATPKKVAAYEAAKLVTDFDPQARDENELFFCLGLRRILADNPTRVGGTSQQGRYAKQRDGSTCCMHEKQ